MTVNDKGAEITRQSPDGRMVISQSRVVIRHTGKPVSGVAIGEGYVYLVVDCSGSMLGDKLSQAKRGASNFAKDALAKGYSTGLIRFDSSARLLYEPHRGTSELNRCLDGLEAGDTTHMAKAIHLAHNNLKGRAGARAMVIVTDGMPNGDGDPRATLRAGANAKKEGIDIIAIGTDDADQGFLKKLASRKELGVRVSRKQLEQTISSSAKMLPATGQLKLGR